MYNITSVSPVNFRQTPRYAQDVEYYPVEDYITQEDIENARDNDVAKLKDTQNEMNKFAESLEANNNKVTKKLGKGVKIASSLIGLAVTYTTAKYGAKISMNILKDLVKSPTAQNGLNSVKSGLEQFSKIKDSKFAQSLINGIKNSSIGKKTLEMVQKPVVKEALKLAGKGANEIKKHITPTNIQTAIENTLAASTTASVLIDNLAGRNDDKSAIAIAMGASGGDQ